jgi:hypothetical protein
MQRGLCGSNIFRILDGKIVERWVTRTATLDIAPDRRLADHEAAALITPMGAVRGVGQ